MRRSPWITNACLLALALAATAAPAAAAAPRSAGAHGPGGEFLSEACSFESTGQVNVALNGTPVVVLLASRNGCLTTPVAVVSCRPPVARVSGRPIPALLGANEIRYGGVGADGKPFQAATGFTLTCHSNNNRLAVIAVAVIVVVLLGIGIGAEVRNRRRSPANA